MPHPAVLQELLNAFLHAGDLLSDLNPWSLLPLVDGLSDLQVESVELVELCKLLLCLGQSWVLLVWQSEELLTGVVRLVLTVVHRELLLEVLQLVKGLTW